ncbi:MAG: acyl-CoA dehydrogenase family protein [Acidimicrobiales bacterium]
MDFRLTEEQREFELLARRVAEDLAQQHRTDDSSPPDVNWSLLVDTGLMGLLVANGDGGSGGGMVEAAIFAEQLGRVAAPSAIAGSVLIAPAAIDLVESATQRQQLRSELVSGRPMSVVVGEDLSWPPGPDGFAWGWHRDAAMLAPDASGLAPIDVAEADVRPTEDLGLFVAHITTTVASPNLMESEGGQRFITVANVIMSSLLVGYMRTALDLAVEHAKQREQFGVKIGTFQAIKHICADMLVDLESSRSAAYGAAAIASNASDVRGASRTAATAKAWCGDAGVRVCENSIQVHGGMGFTWECPVHRFLRAALVARSSFMSSDCAVDLLARSAPWT